MEEREELVGLHFLNGKIFKEPQFIKGWASVIFESEESLGEQVRLRNSKGYSICPIDLPSVPMTLKGKRIDVVVGDPMILRNVRVVGTVRSNSLEIPERIRRFFFDGYQIIIFEDEKGKRIYAREEHATILSDAKPYIVPQ